MIVQTNTNIKSKNIYWVTKVSKLYVDVPLSLNIN